MLLFVFGAITFSCQSSEKSQSEQTIPPVAENTPNDLPWLPVTKLDGSRLMVKDLKGKTILVLFQPDCDHCQREAKQIQEHIEMFKDYEMYFVSDAALPQLSQFAREYKLAGVPNVHFANTTIKDVINTLGPLQSPSVFIYSADSRLVKSFIGETPIENILSHL